MDRTRDYLTASQLGIKDWEHRNLIKVRNLLEADMIPAESFNMCVTLSNAQLTESCCGTVGCIGGWMAFLEFNDQDLARLYVSEQHERPSRLTDLFYPDNLFIADWALITSKMAVEAIDNFLLTGDADWRTILKNRQRDKELDNSKYLEQSEAV